MSSDCWLEGPSAASEPADRLVVGDEVVGALGGRAVHAVRGAADDQPRCTAAELFLRGDGTVAGDRRRPSILLRQGHPAVLGAQGHRGVGRLPGQSRQRPVPGVVEAAQTFGSKIGEGACRFANDLKIFR